MSSLGAKLVNLSIFIADNRSIKNVLRRREDWSDKKLKEFGEHPLGLCDKVKLCYWHQINFEAYRKPLLLNAVSGEMANLFFPWFINSLKF